MRVRELQAEIERRRSTLIGLDARAQAKELAGIIRLERVLEQLRQLEIQLRDLIKELAWPFVSWRVKKLLEILPEQFRDEGLAYFNEKLALNWKRSRIDADDTDAQLAMKEADREYEERLRDLVRRAKPELAKESQAVSAGLASPCASKGRTT